MISKECNIPKKYLLHVFLNLLLRLHSVSCMQIFFIYYTVSKEFLSEIEIDITTGGHGFIFTVYKNGHLRILGLHSYQERVEM